MEGLTPNSYSRGVDSHISPENSKWLAENIEGVDEILEEIRRLTEDEYSEVIDAEGCHQQKPELVGHATRICHMYKLLVERYNQLTEEVSLQIPSLVNVKHSAIVDSGSQRASPLQTSAQKSTRPRSEQDGDFKLYPSSGSGSPDSSLKEASEYSMSSDSESESYYSTINKDIVSPMSIKSKVPHSKFVEQTEPQGTEVMVQKIKGEYVDGTDKVKESEDSDMLSRRLAACEEELIIASEKLHFLEKENARLEGELKKQESITVLIDNLNVQLHEAQQSIQMRDANLEMEKQKVLELQYQVAESQFQIDDSKGHVELLMQELKMYREKLEGSEEEIVKLKNEHCNEVSEGTRHFQCQLESAQKEIALLNAKVKESEDSDMLSRRLAACEEELIIASEKFHFLEKENARLEGELKKQESITVLIDNLNVQLHEARQSIQMRDANLEMEKQKVLELQYQVAESQFQIDDSKGHVELLMQELKMYREKLEGSEEEIVKLKNEHCNEVSEGTRHFQCQLESAQKEIALLNAIVEELKAQIRSHQNEIYCCKSEKMEMQAVHDAQVVNLQVGIENLKAEVKDKSEQVEAMNKNLDMLELKYDMLIANKDVLDARVENLNAELSSKNDEIREMNNHLYQLHLEKVEMIAESERARKHSDELKEKVVELQNEVDRQVAVISDRAEEKREAIRQLCFSVEHYRNGYQELRQAFTGLKRRSVLAS